ncbi:MAG: ABC transporter substrate-binding protein, partial [Acidimicrobiales bacterium]
RARSVPPSELVVADLLYDGLTAYDPAVGQAVPALASGWETDEAATTWRFTLDPDAAFTDGAPVRPEDVKASLERVAAAGPAEPAARLLSGIIGSDEVASGAATTLAGVSLEGEDVVVIALAEPLSSFPELLASPLLGIAPEGATADSLDALPAGSGPFRLAAGSSGEDGMLASDVIRLERAPGAAAIVDGVDLVLAEDSVGALALVEAGDADVAYVPSEVGELDGDLDEVAAPSGAELFYGLNLRSPKLADPRLREAIVAAVDQDAISDGVYGANLGPLAGVVPDDVPGGAPGGCGAPCRHDPDRARALVSEAFPHGDAPELFVDVDSGSRQEQVAAAIVSDLEAVGIPASVRTHAIDEYPSFLASGQQEVFRLGWSGGWASAAAYLAPLFRSGSPENVVGLSVPAVDDALDRAAAEREPATRDAAYVEAEALVLAEMPVLLIGQFRTRVAVGDTVRGLELSVTGTFDATRIHLARDR